MSGLVRKILRELNPMSDFEDISFNNVRGLSPDEQFEATVSNARNFLYMIKPLARGTSVGGVAGAVIYAINGDSPQEGFLVGSALTGMTDVIQFSLRYGNKYTKAQDFSKPLL